MVVNQIVVVHRPKLIRLTKTVVMKMKLSVVTMMNTQNQPGCIGVRMLFINSWERNVI